MSERRRYPRYSVSLAATLVSMNQADASPLPSSVREISLGGVFVRCDAPYPPGTFLRLTLYFDEEEAPVSVVGVVRWREGPPESGMGIEVVRESANNWPRYEHFVAACAERSAGIEKRRHPRVPVQLAASVLDLGEKGFVFRKKATATDLSELGVFIETEAPLAAGTFLALELQPAGQDQTVSFMAVVRWRRTVPPMGVGVEIVRIAAADKARLDAMLEQSGGTGQASAAT